MKLLLALFVVFVSVVGCEEPRTYNNALRQELFFKCLDAVPVGPQTTKYNDWAEVVSECGQQALWMSLEYK